MDSNTKKILLACGAAAGVFLLGFGIYKLSQSGQKDIQDSEFKELLLDVRKIGTVRTNEYGVFPFEQFLEIFKVIKKHAKAKLNVTLESLKRERRQHLKNNELDQYRELVIQQTQIEESIYLQVSQIVCTELYLTEEEFQQTQQHYMTQPSFQNRFFASQQQEERMNQNQQKTNQQKSISREELIEVFKYSELLKMEAMVSINESMKTGSQYDVANVMIVNQTIMADKLFLKYGIEEEQFNKAIAEHNLYKDPEVQQILSDNLKALPSDVMQTMMMQMMGQRGDFQDIAAGQDNFM